MKNRDRLRVASSLLTAAVLLTASFAVSAGPPYRTDDPEAVEYKHAEFYVFYQQTLAADGRTGVLPAFEFNYGVYENVQLHLVAPVAFSTPSGQGAIHGYGDTELGVKWQINEETETMPMVGIFPLVEISTGKSDKGLGNSGSQVSCQSGCRRNGAISRLTVVAAATGSTTVRTTATTGSSAGRPSTNSPSI